MGNARARGDYATRKAAAIERGLPMVLGDAPAGPHIMALHSPKLTVENGKRVTVTEHHKNGQAYTSLDGRTKYQLVNQQLRRVTP